MYYAKKDMQYVIKVDGFSFVPFYACNWDKEIGLSIIFLIVQKVLYIPVFGHKGAVWISSEMGKSALLSLNNINGEKCD